VEGHNLLHRAAFGFPARITSPSGRDITLVFGFFALPRAGARSLPHPPEIIVVFDGRQAPLTGARLFPAYKPPVSGDEAVFANLPHICRGLDLLKYPAHRGHGVGGRRRHCQSRQCRRTGARARDHVHRPGLLPVAVRPRVHAQHPAAADRRRIHPAEVREDHDVSPHQWCDYRALTGDKSDNR
jgi:DNA polymerase-1